MSFCVISAPKMGIPVHGVPTGKKSKLSLYLFHMSSIHWNAISSIDAKNTSTLYIEQFAQFCLLAYLIWQEASLATNSVEIKL